MKGLIYLSDEYSKRICFPRCNLESPCLLNFSAVNSGKTTADVGSDNDRYIFEGSTWYASVKCKVDPHPACLNISNNKGVDKTKCTIDQNSSLASHSHDRLQTRICQIRKEMDSLCTELPLGRPQVSFDKTKEYTEELRQLKAQLKMCQDEEHMLSILIKDDGDLDPSPF